MSNGNNKSSVLTPEQGNPVIGLCKKSKCDYANDERVQSLLDLPCEVLILSILSRLDPLRLANMSATCTTIRKIVAEEEELLPQEYIYRQIPQHLSITNDEDLIKYGKYRVFACSVNFRGAFGTIDLPNVKHIAGHLTITNCESSSTSIDSFRKLCVVGAWVTIVGNVTITSIGGFDALTTIGQNLHILRNAHVEDISGFGSLRRVGCIMRIEDCGRLKRISAMPNLRTIKNDAIIKRCSRLELSGFLGSLVSVGSLRIEDASIDLAKAGASFKSLVHIWDFLALENCTIACKIVDLFKLSGNHATMRRVQIEH